MVESEAAAGAAGDPAGTGEPVDDVGAGSGGDFGEVGGEASCAAEAFPVEADFFATFAWYPVRAGRLFWRILRDGIRNPTWVATKRP